MYVIFHLHVEYIDIQLLLSIGLICQLNMSVTACLSLTMVALFLRSCPKIIAPYYPQTKP